MPRQAHPRPPSVFRGGASCPAGLQHRDDCAGGGRRGVSQCCGLRRGRDRAEILRLALEQGLASSESAFVAVDVTTSRAVSVQGRRCTGKITCRRAARCSLALPLAMMALLVASLRAWRTLPGPRCWRWRRCVYGTRARGRCGGLWTRRARCWRHPGGAGPALPGGLRCGDRGGCGADSGGGVRADAPWHSSGSSVTAGPLPDSEVRRPAQAAPGFSTYCWQQRNLKA